MVRATVLGVDKLCTVYNVKGTSMVPTLQDGQTILVEKTKDISVNDVVVANSPEYGVIVKRVSDINGDKVHLISDNKNVEHKIVNGRIYDNGKLHYPLIKKFLFLLHCRQGRQIFFRHRYCRFLHFQELHLQ